MNNTVTIPLVRRGEGSSVGRGRRSELGRVAGSVVSATRTGVYTYRGIHECYCAGASLAMLLARARRRVALVDRATFPSDTLSTHFLWQRGAARLEAWGLLGRLRDRGCEPITEIVFDVGPVLVCGIGPMVGGVAETYCPRRRVLDTVLVEAALDTGTDLIAGFVVTGVVATAGRVSGVRGHRRWAPEASLPARRVVGADGLRPKGSLPSTTRWPSPPDATTTKAWPFVWNGEYLFFTAKTTVVSTTR